MPVLPTPTTTSVGRSHSYHHAHNHIHGVVPDSAVMPSSFWHAAAEAKAIPPHLFVRTTSPANDAIDTENDWHVVHSKFLHNLPLEFVTDSKLMDKALAEIERSEMERSNAISPSPSKREPKDGIIVHSPIGGSLACYKYENSLFTKVDCPPGTVGSRNSASSAFSRLWKWERLGSFWSTGKEKRQEVTVPKQPLPYVFEETGLPYYVPPVRPVSSPEYAAPVGPVGAPDYVAPLRPIANAASDGLARLWRFGNFWGMEKEKRREVTVPEFSPVDEGVPTALQVLPWCRQESCLNTVDVGVVNAASDGLSKLCRFGNLWGGEKVGKRQEVTTPTFPQVDEDVPTAPQVPPWCKPESCVRSGYDPSANTASDGLSRLRRFGSFWGGNEKRQEGTAPELMGKGHGENLLLTPELAPGCRQEPCVPPAWATPALPTETGAEGIASDGRSRLWKVTDVFGWNEKRQGIDKPLSTNLPSEKEVINDSQNPQAAELPAWCRFGPCPVSPPPNYVYPLPSSAGEQAAKPFWKATQQRQVGGPGAQVEENGYSTSTPTPLPPFAPKCSFWTGICVPDVKSPPPPSSSYTLPTLPPPTPSSAGEMVRPFGIWSLWAGADEAEKACEAEKEELEQRLHKSLTERPPSCVSGPCLTIPPYEYGGPHPDSAAALAAKPMWQMKHWRGGNGAKTIHALKEAAEITNAELEKRGHEFHGGGTGRQTVDYWGTAADGVEHGHEGRAERTPTQKFLVVVGVLCAVGLAIERLL